MTHEPMIPIGTKVRLPDTGEAGIVIHTWFEADIQDTDCYVAFFGRSFPTDKPHVIPYVLRYSTTSLELVL